MFRKIGVFMLALILISGCARAAGYDGRAEDEELRAYIGELCLSYGVPEMLVFAVIEKESSWDADAVNYNETCFGLMQIGRINFEWLEEELGLDDPRDPYQNVQAGIYMLSGYLEKYLDYHMALMCYNCGENGARQLWQDGFYTNKYSTWVINRMHELEWEALDAARERLEYQTQDDIFPEEELSACGPNDDRSNTGAFTDEEVFSDAPDILTTAMQTEDTEETASALIFYTEDAISKSAGYGGSRQYMQRAVPCRNLMKDICLACIGQK